MRAIVINGYGEPDVLEPRELPDPTCGPEDVRVRVRATALNRADLLQRRGLYPPPAPAPEHEIPGLEYAGEVVEVGSRVLAPSVGDRVMGILSGGGYAEQVCVHHRLTVPIPETLTYAQAAAVPEAFMTANDALAQCELRCGESVLVHAAGSGVGVAAIQLAKVAGATPVIGTAGSEEKLEAARKLGLDVAINYRSDRFVDGTREATAGRGADVILDFVGASYLDDNLRAMADRGRLIVIGMLGGISAELNLAVLLAKRIRIIGTVLRARSLEEKAMATRAFEKSVVPHLSSGRVRAVVDRVFALDDVVSAHRYMESNANFGKIVLEV